MNNQQNSNEVSEPSKGQYYYVTFYNHVGEYLMLYNGKNFCGFMTETYPNDEIDFFKPVAIQPKSNTINEPITDQEIDAEIERYIKQFWPRPEHGGAVRLGFKRAVRWMQERQVQPVKNEELYEKFKEAIIGFEHDAQQSITGLSNKCLGIAERYAASKLNNTIEGKWLDTKPEFNKECVFITATKYNRNSEDLEYDYACWQIKKLDGEDENGNPAWYFGLLNGDGEEWGAVEDLGADYYLIIPEVGK